MPRKMAGMAMITIDESMVAISTPIVVLVNTTHLYRSLRALSRPVSSGAIMLDAAALSNSSHLCGRPALGRMWPKAANYGGAATTFWPCDPPD